MPFGRYKDFKECADRNKDKRNPTGYCAVMHKRTTGKWPAEE